ncbi:unnamed protein product [Bemisia tabaci]|uniref:Ty3 transposon capsid-like protein domain-containing protein n=1 Tax=Bemisia tabaci TaxID=7038 RepID=A0A9P0F1R5_BEMTA|nr:unnamed protein product [Bemisia tabaci]
MSFSEGYNTRNRHNRRGQFNHVNGAPPPFNFNVTPNFRVPPPNFNARFSAPNPLNNLAQNGQVVFQRPIFSAPQNLGTGRGRGQPTLPYRHPSLHSEYSGSIHSLHSNRSSTPGIPHLTPQVTINSMHPQNSHTPFQQHVTNFDSNNPRQSNFLIPRQQTANPTDVLVSNLLDGINEMKLAFQSEIVALRNEVANKQLSPASIVPSADTVPPASMVPNAVSAPSSSNFNLNVTADEPTNIRIKKESDLGRKFDFRPKFRDLPKYSGKDDDVVNPKEFIQEIDNFFMEADASEISKLSNVSRQLLGDARVWFSAYSSEFKDYQDFKDKFLKHFWGEERQSKVRSSLCVPNQYKPEMGSMTAYFLKRLHVARRLDERIPERSLIRDIVGHFNDEVKWAVTHCNATSVDTVIEKLQALDALNAPSCSSSNTSKPSYQRPNYQKPFSTNL